MASRLEKSINAVKRYMGAANSVGHSAAVRDAGGEPANYRDEAGKAYLLTFADLREVVAAAERVQADES